MSEPTSKATRYNQNKNMVGLITPKFKEGLGAALTVGATKYGRDNWRKGLKVREVLDSLNRHLLEIEKGEDVDPESGLPHWAHLAANLMFVAEFSGDPLWDDRIKEPKRARFEGRVVEKKDKPNAPFPTEKSVFTENKPSYVEGKDIFATDAPKKDANVAASTAGIIYQLPYDPCSPCNKRTVILKD